MSEPLKEAWAGKFRKRPVVIDAIQWTGANTREVVTFIDGEKPDTRYPIASDAWDEFCSTARRRGLRIMTLEDGLEGEAKHVASPGDWIIRGVQGEHYPCKPDIFAATYEPFSALTAPRLEPETGDGENAIGAAERAVGQYAYRRLEALMEARADTPLGRELSYLADVISCVEEYGALGDEDANRASWQFDAAPPRLQPVSEGYTGADWRASARGVIDGLFGIWDDDYLIDLLKAALAEPVSPHVSEEAIALSPHVIRAALRALANELRASGMGFGPADLDAVSGLGEVHLRRLAELFLALGGRTGG